MLYNVNVQVISTLGPGGSGYDRDGDDRSGYCKNGYGGSSEYKRGDSENRRDAGDDN